MIQFSLFNIPIRVLPWFWLTLAFMQPPFSRLRSSHELSQRPSSQKQFLSNRGDLLIITGSGETNTHIEITEGLVDRLIALGKRFDYFVYPNRDHDLSAGEGTKVHVQMQIARYLIEHLPPGPK